MYKRVYYTGKDFKKVRVRAALIGLKKLGYRIINKQENPKAVKAGKYDFALAEGLRPISSAIQKVIKRKFNKDTLVLDLGYLKRAIEPKDENGYNQLSINACGWVTPIACDKDRFEQLQMPLESVDLSERQTILLCGQVPLDGQHKLTKQEIESWLAQAYDKLKPVFGTDAKFLFRPHPLAVHLTIPREIDGMQNPTEIKSWDALNLDARCIVSYNSTFCVEALLKGIPVYCNKGAHFRELTCDEDTDVDGLQSLLKCPEESAREDYFHRLAYSQWTIQELSSGEALEFTIGQLRL